MPIKPIMHETTLSFLQTNYTITDLQRHECEFTITRFTFKVNGIPLYLSFDHTDQVISLLGSAGGSSTLVETIGKAFDEAMRAGKCQQDHSYFREWTYR